MKPKFNPDEPYEIVKNKSSEKKKPEFNPDAKFEILSGEEVEPREPSFEIPGLPYQKEIAEFTTDMSKLAGHGASQALSDEALAGMETGSFSSPEYISKRDEYRKAMQGRKEEYPILGSIAEAAGSVATTSAIPFLKTAPAVKELISAAVSGSGEAKEMGDIPREATKSFLIQGAAETAGKVLKETLFDDPTKILTRSIGVRSGDIKGDTGAKVIKATDRLNAAGFFKQGDVALGPKGHAFKRNAKDLTTYLKPLTDASLYKRATDNISLLKSRNAALLKGKKLPSIEFKKALYEGVQELTYDPKAFDVDARLGLARDLVDIVEKDLRIKGGYTAGQSIDASDVELAKQSLDAHMKGPAFEKKLTDLGIDKQGMMKFRTKLDDVLDSKYIGGEEYRKNNDLMSDLIAVSEILETKEAGSYVDTGTRMVNTQNFSEKLKDFFSPTSVDIVRSDISKLPSTKLGGFGARTIKRIPMERYTGRDPQSVEFTPREIINYRVPLSTQGILENKDRVLAKFTQKGLADEMLETLTMALNGDSEDIANIMPLIMTQMPEMFEKSKYKVFDGKFLDPNDKAKAADSISKRNDLNSIERAKMINKINRNNEVPEGM